ncbi:MAG: hypothetical protein ABW219_00480, partial [Ilumatobacteraceae bacterium]
MTEGATGGTVAGGPPCEAGAVGDALLDAGAATGVGCGDAGDGSAPTGAVVAGVRAGMLAGDGAPDGVGGPGTAPVIGALAVARREPAAVEPGTVRSGDGPDPSAAMTDVVGASAAAGT